MTKKELIAFEEGIASLFKAGKIRCPVHLSSGNEEKLIEIFKDIAKDDYVFSTHRNHLHYLLHTGQWDTLTKHIMVNNDSMHTCDPEHNFYSSSIVGGCVAIACGVALALKRGGCKNKVWCFVGDAGVDEGWFHEAHRYAVGQDLPIKFIIENNDRSVCTSVKQRWGKDDAMLEEIDRCPKIVYYKYKCKYPHCGVGEFVNLEGDK